MYRIDFQTAPLEDVLGTLSDLWASNSIATHAELLGLTTAFLAFAPERLESEIAAALDTHLQSKGSGGIDSLVISAIDGLSAINPIAAHSLQGRYWDALTSGPSRGTSKDTVISVAGLGKFFSASGAAFGNAIIGQDNYASLKFTVFSDNLRSALPSSNLDRSSARTFLDTTMSAGRNATRSLPLSKNQQLMATANDNCADTVKFGITMLGAMVGTAIGAGIGASATYGAGMGVGATTGFGLGMGAGSAFGDVVDDPICNYTAEKSDAGGNAGSDESEAANDDDRGADSGDINGSGDTPPDSDSPTPEANGRGDETVPNAKKGSLGCERPPDDLGGAGGGGSEPGRPMPNVVSRLIYKNNELVASIAPLQGSGLDSGRLASAWSALIKDLIRMENRDTRFVEDSLSWMTANITPHVGTAYADGLSFQDLEVFTGNATGYELLLTGIPTTALRLPRGL